MEDFEQVLVLIKHGGFRDEREVRRIVSVLNRPDLGEEWPGVVRHRASAYGIAPYVALTGGTVTLTTMQGSERDTIVAALRECDGNRVHAAKSLGISRSSLYRKIASLRITEI